LLYLQVIPLAITHFGDSVLVASCAFLLELCGLSASMLRIDVASLRRISSFYKSNGNADMAHQKSLKRSMFHSVSSEDDLMGSLARALANEYAYPDISSVPKQKQNPSISGSQPGLPLMLVLHHLEQASLPEIGVGRKTSGYWLLTGDGDGSELRSQQTSASLHWSLVTLFCQMHKIPLSTKYLAMLARDNDWVCFMIILLTFSFLTLELLLVLIYVNIRLDFYLRRSLEDTHLIQCSMWYVSHSLLVSEITNSNLMCYVTII